MVEADILRENDMDSLKLALEGQQRCQRGDMLGGVWYLEAALGAGTDDLKTLSAVYSQLGNAYFVLQQYGKALEYHRHDHTLASSSVRLMHPGWMRVLFSSNSNCHVGLNVAQAAPYYTELSETIHSQMVA
ncbi:G-protein-signaling modulator 2 [Trichinella sp. T8]|nr:G-protein-signaling modulator 2 [Trichinella sp. T8]